MQNVLMDSSPGVLAELFRLSTVTAGTHSPSITGWIRLISSFDWGMIAGDNICATGLAGSGFGARE